MEADCGETTLETRLRMEASQSLDENSSGSNREHLLKTDMPLLGGSETVKRQGLVRGFASLVACP